MSYGSPAPPLNRIMLVFRSACRHRDMPCDGPDKACEFTGDRSGDDIGRLASAGEPAIPRAQSQLRLPRNLADRLGLALLSEQQLTADPCREAVTPGGLDQQPAGGAVAGLGKTAAFDARSARMLGRHQPDIGHQL